MSQLLQQLFLQQPLWQLNKPLSKPPQCFFLQQLLQLLHESQAGASQQAGSALQQAFASQQVGSASQQAGSASQQAGSQHELQLLPSKSTPSMRSKSSKPKL